MLCAYIAFLWCVAGFVAGVTSFGGNLFAVPLAALAVSPRVAILSGCISGTAVFLAIAIIYRRGIIWKECLCFCGASCLGMPCGIWFLEHAGSRALLLGAGFCLCAFLVWQFLATRLKPSQKPVSQLFVLPFGVASGIMMSSMGMGGPALVLYAFLRRFSKEQTLGTVNAASVAMMFIILPSQWNRGLFSADMLIFGIAGAILAVVGIILSVPVVRRLNIALFRRLLLAMLSLSAIVLIVRAAME